MAFKRRLRFDKRIKFKKKMSIMYILLFVVMLSLGVGYSYIKSDLNINGTAKVKNARFDVHFDNLQVSPYSVTATTPATITDATTIEFAATLENPGDYYEFAVDIVNSGTMDAMINNIEITPELTSEQSNYFDILFSTDDGFILKDKSLLPKETSEKIMARFFYYETGNPTDYPVNDQVFNVKMSIDYVQADSSAIETNKYIYSIFGKIKGVFASSIDESYDSYQELLDNYSSFGLRSFFRYSVGDSLDDQNVIGKESIGFIYNNTVYYLIGGAQFINFTSFGALSLYYEQNKNILLNAFGNSNCVYDNTDIECEADNFTAYANFDGTVRVIDNGQQFEISWGSNAYGPNCLGAC